MNKIGLAGGRALADALEHNHTLLDLNLQCNVIGDEGVRLISQALRWNTSLTCILLDDNQISRQGLLPFAFVCLSCLLTAAPSWARGL
jgi:Ran GTPase-activating protein (RanGAP) involved in mRNA processing and transport